MFALKSPCKSCPFRRGVGSEFQLTRERLWEIKDAVAFQCHATVDYGKADDPVARQGKNPAQCAGLMAVLARENIPNAIMQVGARFGHLDMTALDPRGEAYASWREVVRAHTEGVEP